MPHKASNTDSQFDDQNVEALISALKVSDREIRWNAAVKLGEIGDKRAIEPLIGALKDGYIPVNLPAAEALVQIGEPAVIPLIKALEDKVKTVRFFSAEILGKIGDRRSVEALINALKENEADVRHSAAEALGKIGDTRALPALELVAQNDNGEAIWWEIPVRETALKAIQRIKNERI